MIGSPIGAAADREMQGQRVIVPAHFDVEMLSALIRLCRRGMLSDEQAGDAIARVRALPAKRASLIPLLAPAFALRHGLSPGDAPYVVLARLEGATLVTSDARLARAAADIVAVKLVAQT